MGILAWLNPTRWIILLAAVGALTLGYFAWAAHEQGIGEARATERYNLAIAAQKQEAKTKLLKLAQDKLEAEMALAKLIAQMEKNREISQAKNTADLHRNLIGHVLHFSTKIAGRGSSGGSTASKADQPTGNAETADIQLPKQINDDLWNLAADAQSLAIDYSILYNHLHNPNLVCELRKE